MFVYTKTQDTYANLSPRFDGSSTVLNFKGIKVQESDDLFNWFTYVTDVQAVQTFDESTRKFVGVDFTPQVCKVKFVKKAYESYGKKKEPTKLDLFAIEQLKKLLGADPDGNFIGQIDLTTDSWIDKLETAKDEQIKEYLLGELLKVEATGTIPEFADFVVPSTGSSFGGKSSYARSAQSVESKLSDKLGFITKQMGVCCFGDESKPLYESISYMTSLMGGETIATPLDKANIKAQSMSTYFDTIVDIAKSV